MDVRNGILMWTPLNARFDKFDFTIIKSNGKYVVETLEEHEFEKPTSEEDKKLQMVIAGLNGNPISFNQDKQNEWPGANFLKFHNECFYSNKTQRLKAAAEPQDLESDEDIEEVERVYIDYKVETWLRT